ncbi:unnamed protein product [Linum tenue]|uniref:Uncharacterized protein n=1 Tax=Linum tenue TaxID=586396 RepID=A0AAV0I203_9ROSI|nr:unnamed protein product [Linum tenue]
MTVDWSAYPIAQILPARLSDFCIQTLASEFWHWAQMAFRSSGNGPETNKTLLAR